MEALKTAADRFAEAVDSIGYGSGYGGYGSGAIYTNARMDTPAAEASTMVQASSLEVVATVTMEFALAEGE